MQHPSEQAQHATEQVSVLAASDDFLNSFPPELHYPMITANSLKELWELKAKVFENPKISPYLFYLFCHPDDPIWVEYIRTYFTRQPRFITDETPLGFIKRLSFLFIGHGMSTIKFSAGGRVKSKQAYRDRDVTNISLSDCIHHGLEIPFQAKLLARKNEDPNWLLRELNEARGMQAWLAIPADFYQRIKSYHFKNGEITVDYVRIMSSLPGKKEEVLKPLLYIAARANHANDVALLYACFSDEEKKKINFQLYLACVASGLIAVARTLQEAKPKFAISYLMDRRLTALHIAAQNGQDDCMDLIVQAIPTHDSRIQQQYVAEQAKDQGTALELACEHGHANVVVRLLKAGADITQSSYSAKGNNFHRVVRQGNLAVLRALLEKLRELQPEVRKRVLHEKDQFFATPLYCATVDQKIQVVTCLLDVEDVDPNIGKQGDNDFYLESPLYAALKKGDRACAALFLNHPRQKFDLRTSYGATLLHGALQGRIDSALPHLFEKGLQVATEDNHGDHGLHVAAQYSTLDAFQLLLQRPAAGALLAKTNKNDANPFYVACAHGQYLIADYLLKLNNNSFDLNQESKEGLTPLAVAWKNHRWFIVKRLLQDPRVSIHDIDKDGNSLLHYVLLESKNAKTDKKVLQEIYQLLYARRDFNPNAANRSGNRPVHLCAEAPTTPLMQEFLTIATIDYAVTNEAGFTPLHLAVQAKNYVWLDRCQALTVTEPKTYFGVNVPNKAGNTILTTLVEHYHSYQKQYPDIRVLTCLLNWGADPNIVSEAHTTPLFDLVNRCSDDSDKVLPHIELLLQRGADPNHPDKDQRTPFSLLLQNFHLPKKIIQLFLNDPRTNVNVSGKDKKTLLHLLVLDWSYDLTLMQSVLTHPTCMPDVEDEAGFTPLMRALERFYASKVKLLLEKGACANYQNKAQTRAIHVLSANASESMSSKDCFDLLSAQPGFEYNAQNSTGQTAVHILAARKSHTNSTLLVLKLGQLSGVKLDLRDQNGNTAVHVAIENNNFLWLSSVIWTEREGVLKEKNQAGLTAVQQMIAQFCAASTQLIPPSTEVPRLNWLTVLIWLPETALQAEFATDAERLALIQELLTYTTIVPANRKFEIDFLVQRCLQYLPKSTVLSEPLFELLRKNCHKDCDWLTLLASFALSLKQKKALIPVIAQYYWGSKSEELLLDYAKDPELFSEVLQTHREDLFFIQKLYALAVTDVQKKLLIPVLTERGLATELWQLTDNQECAPVIFADAAAVTLLAQYAHTTAKRQVLIPAAIRHNLSANLLTLVKDSELPTTAVQKVFEYFADLTHGLEKESLSAKISRLVALQKRGAICSVSNMTTLCKKTISLVTAEIDVPALLKLFEQLLTEENFHAFKALAWRELMEKKHPCHDALLKALVFERNFSDPKNALRQVLIEAARNEYHQSFAHILQSISLPALYPQAWKQGTALDYKLPELAQRGLAIGARIPPTNPQHQPWPKDAFKGCILTAAIGNDGHPITAQSPGCEGAIFTADDLRIHLNRPNHGGLHLADISYYLMLALEKHPNHVQLKAMTFCLFEHLFKSASSKVEPWPNVWQPLAQELATCKAALPAAQQPALMMIEHALQLFIPKIGKPLQPADIAQLKMLSLYCQAQDWPLVMRDRVLMVIGVFVIAALTAAVVASTLFFGLGLALMPIVASAGAGSAFASGAVSSFGFYQFFRHKGTSAQCLNHVVQTSQALRSPLPQS